MNAIITINMDNSAFENWEKEELSRILDNLAYKVQDGDIGNEIPIYDANGNKVGNLVYQE
jgi:hypothetical protein